MEEQILTKQKNIQEEENNHNKYCNQIKIESTQIDLHNELKNFFFIVQLFR